MPRAAQEVAPGVLVATSARMSTTSTIVVTASTVLLVDPAWTADELDSLADLLDERKLRPSAGFATHAHHDHLLWHPRFGDVPRWGSARTAELARTERTGLVEHLGEFDPKLTDLLGRVAPTTTADAIDDVPGVELIVHDGHAPGHTALWLPETEVLIAGDMLSDLELPLPFWPDDLPSYITALDALAPYAARAQVVIPGHGTPGRDAAARLDADRRIIDRLLTGHESDDPRILHPGMDTEYEHLRELCAASR